MTGGQMPVEERQNNSRIPNSSSFVGKEIFISENKKLKLYFCLMFKSLPFQAQVRKDYSLV